MPLKPQDWAMVIIVLGSAVLFVVMLSISQLLNGYRLPRMVFFRSRRVRPSDGKPAGSGSSSTEDIELQPQSPASRNRPQDLEAGQPQTHDDDLSDSDNFDHIEDDHQYQFVNGCQLCEDNHHAGHHLHLQRAQELQQFQERPRRNASEEPRTPTNTQVPEGGNTDRSSTVVNYPRIPSPVYQRGDFERTPGRFDID